jgi:hypothetical protein
VGNRPGTISYPELRNYAERLPIGYLSGDQRHRARAWLGYDVPMPRYIGLLNLSLLQNFDSGTPYSAVTNITLASYRAALLGNAPYVTAPSAQQYYFSDRGEFRLDDVSSTDLAINYRLPISRFELFAQGDVINLFNRQTVTVVNTTVNTANTSTALMPFNPFTTSRDQLIQCPTFRADGTTLPVAQCQTAAPGSHYQLGPNFGKPTNQIASTPTNSFTSNFQVARTYRLSVGFRF